MDQGKSRAVNVHRPCFLWEDGCGKILSSPSCHQRRHLSHGPAISRQWLVVLPCGFKQGRIKPPSVPGIPFGIRTVFQAQGPKLNVFNVNCRGEGFLDRAAVIESGFRELGHHLEDHAFVARCHSGMHGCKAASGFSHRQACACFKESICHRDGSCRHGMEEQWLIIRFRYPVVISAGGEVLTQRGCVIRQNALRNSSGGCHRTSPAFSHTASRPCP